MISEIDKSKMNRLIWGDNLLAMQALLAQGYAGKIDLIYIDPPFKSNTDYNYLIEIEGEQLEKKASIIERLAYTDTWETGVDSYLDMLYSRLQLMKSLLSNQGSVYFHTDWNAGHYVKILLDEVFGQEYFRNEIIWQGSLPHGNMTWKFGKFHDMILYYTPSDNPIWNPQYYPHRQEYIEQFYKHIEPKSGRRYQLISCINPNKNRPNLKYDWNGVVRVWKYTYERMKEMDREGLLVHSKSGIPRYKGYLDEMKGTPMQDVWNDISAVMGSSNERLNYPTQKPQALLERIIKASSNEGDLVADFFCGSGTTMAVAERLNRRWIGSNLDKVGIQVSRNRLVNQQAKPFLLENIGNYQRHMIYLFGSKINEMQRIILKLYGASTRGDRPDLGICTYEDRDPELVYVGYPDRPITAKKAIELAQEAEILDGTGYKTLIVLAWDYDYNFSTELESRKAALRNPLKANIKFLTIPPEIYNYLKQAKNEEDLESLRGKIVFHEKPYLRVSKPQVSDPGNGNVVITLSIDRYVLMNFPIEVKAGKKLQETDKKRREKEAELRRAIKDNFAALIDYWAIDWDYDGKTFKSMWQAIRGNGKRAQTVVTTATSPELPAGKRTVAVRLVDVFGNDASATVEVK